MAETQSPNQTHQSKSDSGLAMVLRSLWIFIGNVVLGVCAISIVTTRGQVFSKADIVYVVTVPLLLAARYLDIARYQGETAYGQPATMADWRRYALLLLVASAAVWLAAHAIAYGLAK